VLYWDREQVLETNPLVLMDNPIKRGTPLPKCLSRFIDLAKVLNKLVPQKMMYAASIL